MSGFFEVDRDLIVVTAHIFGPTGDTVARMALDTGAVGTVIHPKILVALGYDLSQATSQVRIITASGVGSAPRLALNQVKALDQEETGLLVTCHALPPTAGVEGLLGLNFIRRQRLVVDFDAGQITLT